MIDCDLCLEKITLKKRGIMQGYDATHDVCLYIRVIDRAIEHARHVSYDLEGESEDFGHNLPTRYQFMIQGSSCDSDGFIAIPGIFRLLDKISEDMSVIAQSLIEGVPYLFPERTYDALEIRNKILYYNAIIRDPDCITHHPDLPFFRTQNADDPDTLYNVIIQAQCTLKEMIHRLSPKEEYGAFCYNLESSDRFMIRAFMQGVHRMIGIDTPDSPVILGIRDRDRLIIGLFMDDLFDRYALIEVRGLYITIHFYERYPQGLQSFAGHLAPLQILWRKNSSDILFDEGTPDNRPVESGTFHARSLTDALQFLSDAGYYMSRYTPDTFSCGKIAG